MIPLASIIIPVTVAAGGGPVLHFADDPGLGGFLDIAGFGQPQFLGADGEAELDAGSWPGNFIYLPGVIIVGQNGGLGFGNATVTPLEPDNEPIPSTNAFINGQAALAFWDDIDDKDGDILFFELSGDPVLSDRLIVQWEYPNFDGLGSTLTIQAHLLHNFQPTGIYSQFAFAIDGPATSAGDSATIGYQDGSTGYGDLQYSFNQPDAIADGTVVSLIIPEPGDLDIDGRVGTADFLILLAAWGPCVECPPQSCPADLDFDCEVGVIDFLMLLQNWDA